MSARDTMRWAVTHGVTRAVLRLRARSGNTDAKVLVDPELQRDPYASYELLRTDAALVPGAFARVTVHHDVCNEVLRSDDFGVAGRDDSLPLPIRLALRLAGPPAVIGPITPPSMLAVDPPAHTRYRRLVSRAFTARAVERLRERTQTVADELLDELDSAAAARPDGTVDLVERYASLLPVTIISEMLGVPTSMREQFLAWGDEAAAALDLGLDRRTHRTVERNLAELGDWMLGHLRRLRREPGDDLLSKLVTVADDDGSGLTETELLATALLVLGAGFETTVNLIGNGAALLFAHPEQRRVLADDPTLWSNAVDEMLRFEPPVQRTARSANRATSVGGVDVPAGELVVTLLAAANRDPKVFPDPHTFDVARTNAKDHVAFSSGIHFCLGAALARMEGEIALRSLFERFPDLASAGPAARRGTRILHGWASMPVRPGVPVGRVQPA